MSDNKPKWDQPTNLLHTALDPAAALAEKHGISSDRAQMLIERLGEDSVRLDAAAAALRINPKK